MRDVIVQRMKADHEYEQGRLPLADRRAFDEDDARKIAEETCPADQSIRYLWGISWAPSTTKEVFDEFCTVSQHDGCFMHGETQGTMFASVGVDGGGHIVPYAVSIFIDNEREATWQIHFDFIEVQYPTFDSPTRRCIADLQKGLVKALENFCQQGLYFSCYTHHKKHVMEHTSKGGMKQYSAAVFAPTKDQVGTRVQTFLLFLRGFSSALLQYSFHTNACVLRLLKRRTTWMSA